MVTAWYREGMRKPIPPNELRRNLVGFKLNDDEYAALLPFFETFQWAPMSSAMLWLMEHEDVKKVIQERIKWAMVQA